MPIRLRSTRTMFGLLILLASASGVAADKPQFLNSRPALELGRPFSEAVRAGDFLFLSGQIGEVPETGKLAEGGLEAEARQAVTNMKRVLEANGSSPSDVVKCTVFLADIADWPAFNAIYRQFFQKPFPARSALAASGLAMNARVELECIAYLRVRCRSPESARSNLAGQRDSLQPSRIRRVCGVKSWMEN